MARRRSAALSLQFSHDSITDFLSSRLASQVRCTDPRIQHDSHRVFDLLGFGFHIEGKTEHESHTENHGYWIGDILAGDTD